MHGDEEYESLKRSIETFGYVDPVIINADGTVIGGHQRLFVLRDLGYSEADVAVVDLSKADEKALNIALNKISGEWDEEKLAAIFAELDAEDYDLTLTGFGEDEFVGILTSDDIGFVDVETADENLPTPLDIVFTKPKDVWIIGQHRLMCGDSTNSEDVRCLMERDIARCLFTSPPYNMGANANLYANYEDNLESKKYIDFNLSVVDNFRRHLKGFLFWNISYNKNSRWEFIEIMHRIIKETGMKFLELIVWDKGHGMPIVSRDMLTRQYEDILMVGDEEIFRDLEFFYLGKNDISALFNKKRGVGISNYWRIDTANTQIEEHKACFPVKLPLKAIDLTTDEGDIVVDCFGGSGTTLIACEATGRICRTMEYDPKYCDVIVKRYASVTGKRDISLVRNGREIPVEETGILD